MGKRSYSKSIRTAADVPASNAATRDNATATAANVATTATTNVPTAASHAAANVPTTTTSHVLTGTAAASDVSATAATATASGATTATASGSTTSNATASDAAAAAKTKFCNNSTPKLQTRYGHECANTKRCNICSSSEYSQPGRSIHDTNLRFLLYYVVQILLGLIINSISDQYI